MNKIILQNISVEGSLVKYNFSVNQEMKKYFNAETMFLRYDQSVQSIPLSILTIPFVNCMIGLSWLANAKVFVDEIDETYYKALKQIKVAYSELHGANLKGVLVPSVIRKNEINKNDRHLLLFGGGVDCHSSYLRNRDKVLGVINIYGWAKDELDVSSVDVSDKKNTGAFAEKYGISSYHVTSNFASQFNLGEIDKELGYRIIGTNYWYGLLHSMAFLAISTPIAWLNDYSNLMIASSFSKGRIDVRCASYITTDSEFRFARNGHVIHDGFELNRQDKVKVLVNYQKSEKTEYPIQACSFNDQNCCKCEKCFRTIID